MKTSAPHKARVSSLRAKVTQILSQKLLPPEFKIEAVTHQTVDRARLSGRHSHIKYVHVSLPRVKFLEQP
jgi:hypothetical protein